MTQFTELTPEEIAARAAAIRAEWSEDKRRERLAPNWREVTLPDGTIVAEPIPIEEIQKLIGFAET